MYESCIINILQVVLVISTIVSLNVETTESSGDYLRKVMIELQELKTPHISPLIYFKKNFPAGKRLSESNSNFLPTSVYHKNVPKQTDNVNAVEIDSNHQYYHHHHHHPISAPIVVPEPSSAVDESIELTKNQLATIYNQALKSGNAINWSTLKNTLASGHYPIVNDNQLQIPIPQQYMYHFYPLRSFMDTLQDNHGYKTLDNLYPQSPGVFQESNKQIVINPLFMAVSSFIGMALVFMFGVIFLPRIFDEFKSRVVHDEFVNLTANITEAIDHYNTTTTRPKTRFSGAIVGIKTRPVPGVGGATRRRRKTQRPDEKNT